MKELIIDSLVDTLKILPYLFITFLILEFIEHKFSHKSSDILSKNKKFGPIIGGILGGIPQCGFSVAASRIFSSKIITIGTLISVYLATSDEMLPIMLSEKVDFLLIISIIGFKVLVGIIVGILVDLIYKKRNKSNVDINDICHEEHCDCDSKGIIYSSVKHTLKIFLFILLANLIIGFVIETVGSDTLSNILLGKNILTYFGASLIGLIPNCASSVLITKLYISGLITVGTMLSGLLTGSGLGILILFKDNKNMKENIMILSIIYLVGVLVGILVDLII
ncbi:MAG: arsenic efflux protein [Bacilli bacterium]|nr:arsenic efflux protein [Bacilli bacterium]